MPKPDLSEQQALLAAHKETIVLLSESHKREIENQKTSIEWQLRLLQVVQEEKKNKS